PRVPELAGDAERAGEIEVPDPEAIDALHGRDRVRILGARGRLDLHEQAVARVQGLELLRHRPTRIVVVRQADADAAVAVGIVLDVADQLLGFARVVDQRYHDALGAHVG